jgi:hypothetical protein
MHYYLLLQPFQSLHSDFDFARIVVLLIYHWRIDQNDEGINNSESMGMLIQCLNMMHIFAVFEMYETGNQWFPNAIKTELKASPYQILRDRQKLNDQVHLYISEQL